MTWAMWHRSVSPPRFLESRPSRPRHPGDPFQGLDRLLFAEGANEGAEFVPVHLARRGVEALNGTEDRDGVSDSLFDEVEPDVCLALEINQVLTFLHPRGNEIGADR